MKHNKSRSKKFFAKLYSNVSMYAKQQTNILNLKTEVGFLALGYKFILLYYK